MLIVRNFEKRPKTTMQQAIEQAVKAAEDLAATAREAYECPDSVGKIKERLNGVIVRMGK